MSRREIYILCTVMTLCVEVEAVEAPTLSLGVDDVQGVNYHSLHFDTLDWVDYSVQTSTDLQTWTEFQVIQGTGHTMALPLVEVSTGSGSGGGGGTAVTDIVVIFLKPALSGGTLASWSSLNDNVAIQHHLSSLTLSSSWNTQPIYAGVHGSYMLFLIANPSQTVAAPSNLPTLPTDDQNVIDELTQNWTSIENALLSQSGPAVMPIISTGPAQFVRVAASPSDRDYDGIPDHEEHNGPGGTGTDQFDPDTDGDGVFDGEGKVQGTDPTDPNDEPAGSSEIGSGVGALNPLRVVEVSFHDSHQISPDDKSILHYRFPQWREESHNWPVAYTKDHTPTIGAKFHLPGAVAPKIQVSGTDGVSILVDEQGNPRWIPLKPGNGVDEWNLPPTLFDDGFPDTIKFYNAQELGQEFILQWVVDLIGDGSTTPSGIGTTLHTVYITLKAPIQSNDNQETMFNIACSNADGMNIGQEAAIADAIFGLRGAHDSVDATVPDVEFAKRSVPRVIPTQGKRRNERMTYYEVIGVGGFHECQTAAELLEVGDAACGAWAQLYAETLKKHGLPGKRVNITPIPTVGDRLFVANGEWDANPPNPPHQDYPWLYYNLAPNTGTVRTGVNIGVPGQGIDDKDPPKVFGNHVIAQHEGTWYDPSYGSIKFDDPDPNERLKDFENNSIEGIGVEGQDQNGTVIIVFQKTDPQGPLQLQFQVE